MEVHLSGILNLKSKEHVFYDSGLDGALERISSEYRDSNFNIEFGDSVITHQFDVDNIKIPFRCLVQCEYIDEYILKEELKKFFWSICHRRLQYYGLDYAYIDYFNIEPVCATKDKFFNEFQYKDLDTNNKPQNIEDHKPFQEKNGGKRKIFIVKDQ